MPAASEFGFDDREPARQVVQCLRLLEKAIDQLQDGRRRGGAGQVDHYDTRVLIGRIITDLGEIEIARQQRQLRA